MLRCVMFQLVLFSLLITKPLIQSKCHHLQSVIDALIRMFFNSFCWYEFKLSQNFFRRINWTADAQRMWPRTAREYVFPLNIWLTSQVCIRFRVLSLIHFFPLLFRLNLKRSLVVGTPQGKQKFSFSLKTQFQMLSRKVADQTWHTTYLHLGSCTALSQIIVTSKELKDQWHVNRLLAIEIYVIAQWLLC